MPTPKPEPGEAAAAPTSDSQTSGREPGQAGNFSPFQQLSSRLLAAGTLKVGDLQETVPVHIGRYTISGSLGHGATGQVYRAHDPKIGRDVAVKLLDPNMSRRSSQQRFSREVKALARLRHPNIVEIYDTGIYEGRPYFVMEVVEGLPLDQAGLPLPSMIVALRLVAEACHTAHRSSVVHRDLKPSNILLGERLVVVDFGLARFLDDPQRVTSRGVVLGTPAYMSPEQARGEEVDHRADIYSLGVMIYEAVTGQRPFGKATPWGFIELVASVEPPRPSELVPDLAADLERIILAAMAKDKEKRTVSAGQLAAELGEWLEKNGLPVHLIPRAQVPPLEQPRVSSCISSFEQASANGSARQTVSVDEGLQDSATASWSLLLSDALSSDSPSMTADATVALQPNQQTVLEEVVSHLERTVSVGGGEGHQRQEALLSAARARLVMAAREGDHRARCIEQAMANLVAALRLNPGSEACCRAVCAVCRWVFSRGAAGMSEMGGAKKARELAAGLFEILETSTSTRFGDGFAMLVKAHAQLLRAAALLSDSFSNTRGHQLRAASAALADAIQTLQGAEDSGSHHSDLLLAQCAGYLLTAELQQAGGRKGGRALGKADAALERLQAIVPGHPELGLWHRRCLAARGSRGSTAT